MQTYNPVVRTFCQVPSAVLSCVDIDRRDFRPSARLDALLPLEKRQEVWRTFRAHGIKPPWLERVAHNDDWVVAKTAFESIKLSVSLAAAVHQWWVAFACAPVFGAILFHKRPRVERCCVAADFPMEITTVGELVIASINFAGHKESGYRWTHNEIALKVRLVIADQMGMSLHDVQPEKPFMELGFD
jgi:hypothetical protein